MVSVKHDEEAKALCFYTAEGKVAKTASLGKDRFPDVDEKGGTAGPEVLLPDRIPTGAEGVIPDA